MMFFSVHRQKMLSIKWTRSNKFIYLCGKREEVGKEQRACLSISNRAESEREDFVCVTLIALELDRFVAITVTVRRRRREIRFPFRRSCWLHSMSENETTCCSPSLSSPRFFASDELSIICDECIRERENPRQLLFVNRQR